MSRGFAAAQRHLGISAANISVHIGQLERRLGVRLCDRGRKGFRLTEEGRVIYDAALTLFRATDHFRSTVGSTRGRLVGEIHFGFVDAVITNPALKLEETIATFTRAAPDTQLNLDISSPQELVQGLLEDRYHVVLSPQLERRDGLAYVPYREERKSLYCGRTHPLFKRADGGISLEELADTPAVARSYMSEWLSIGSLKLHNSATASHVESLALMILSGCFIGHLPDHYAARWVAAGEMRPLLENKISYVDWFHLAYRSNERNRAALAFIDLLTGRIRPNDAAAGRATKSPFAARPSTISR